MPLMQLLGGTGIHCSEMGPRPFSKSSTALFYKGNCLAPVKTWKSLAHPLFRFRDSFCANGLPGFVIMTSRSSTESTSLAASFGTTRLAL